MKSLLNILLVCALALLTMQCEVVNDHLLQDPNNPAPENVDANFLLNRVEVRSAREFRLLQGDGGALTRMYHFGGSTYKSAYSPTNFDNDWEGAYSDVLKDIKTLIPLAQGKGFYTHVGIARVLRAYLLTNLVDKFGPVPFSEALDEANFNPDVDSGPDIYAFAMADLDSAITDFNKESVRQPANDQYYDGSDENWITLANTLKLNLLVKTRLVNDNTTAIQTLIDNGDLITTNDQAFILRYSTTDTNPDSRSNEFANNYTSTGASGTYMSDYYMNLLVNDQIVEDPRLRYYFYRQVDENPTNINSRQCLPQLPPNHYTGVDGSGKNGNDPFCDDWNDKGYWGRDHGLNTGLPPDNGLKTTYGVYPYGGRFDADQAEQTDRDQGLQGAGIRPMWLPFYTDFLKAEIKTTLNIGTKTAREYLEDGVRGSISYVLGFAAGNNPTGVDAVSSEPNGTSFVPTDATIDQFVSGVLADYDASAGDTQAQLNEIAKEYYIALWGNGMEAYNLYRRVAPAQHAPNWHLQPSVFPDTGTFPRSFIYAAEFVERNSTVSQKSGLGVKVFWDTNPDGIFDF